MSDVYNYIYQNWIGNSLALNKNDIDNLWDKGLTLEEDFDLIHLLYIDVLQGVHENYDFFR